MGNDMMAVHVCYGQWSECTRNAIAERKAAERLRASNKKGGNVLLARYAQKLLVMTIFPGFQHVTPNFLVRLGLFEGLRVQKAP